MGLPLLKLDACAPDFSYVSHRRPIPLQVIRHWRPGNVGIWLHISALNMHIWKPLACVGSLLHRLQSFALSAVAEDKGDNKQMFVW